MLPTPAAIFGAAAAAVAELKLLPPVAMAVAEAEVALPMRLTCAAPPFAPVSKVLLLLAELLLAWALVMERPGLLLVPPLLLLPSPPPPALPLLPPPPPPLPLAVMPLGTSGVLLDVGVDEASGVGWGVEATAVLAGAAVFPPAAGAPAATARIICCCLRTNAWKTGFAASICCCRIKAS